MFIEIENLQAAKAHISSIKVDEIKLELHIIFDNGQAITETFNNVSSLNERLTELKKDLLWIGIQDIALNIFSVASLNTEDTEKDYSILYILHNGSVLTELFDSASTRDEKYNYVLNLKFSGGGSGGGGTDDYNDLTNKPLINGNVLFGDISSEDIGVQDKLIAGDGIEIVGSTISSTGGSNTYTNNDPSVIAVGGIKVNTTFNNKTMTEMFDMMLYPELYPTLSNPKLTTTLSKNIIEVGLTENVQVTGNFSRGSISPAYGTSGFRSGLPISYNFNGTVFESTNTKFTNQYTATSTTEKSTNISLSCTYSGGEQPLSSKGNNYNTPLSSGTSSTNSAINFVFPYYATTSDITAMTKQTLIKLGSYIQVILVGEDDTNKQSISYADIHGVVSRITVLNTLNNQWEDAELNSFTRTVETRDINGVSQDFNKYTFNGSKIGSRTIRFYI